MRRGLKGDASCNLRVGAFRYWQVQTLKFYKGSSSLNIPINIPISIITTPQLEIQNTISVNVIAWIQIIHS
jgi:hypothetical protein